MIDQVRLCDNCDEPTNKPKWARWCKICAPKMERQGQYKAQLTNRRELGEYKISLGCSVCGYNKSPAALDFHHLDPQTKHCRVSANWKTPKGKEEMKKCVLICKNCHA